MTTAPIAQYPDVAPPAGASAIDDWQADDPQPSRVVIGSYRTVTDHNLRVSTSAVQWADGSIDDGRVEAPHIYVEALGESNPLNSDQARELAAVLLVAAAEVDGWMAR
jgi:hypothetical protein